MLAFAGESIILVDCGGDVIQRLLIAGVDVDRVEALILTHEHPDHISGFPLFMEKIWLAGRRRPIPVVGPDRAIALASRLFDTFDTSRWKGVPQIDWGVVRLERHEKIWISDEWNITASPGEHSVPVMGIRVKAMETANVVVYSADTARTESIIDLARGADILVHEATGKFAGHTTVMDAARVAQEAGVKRLVLVHLPPAVDEAELKAARELIADLDLGRDGDRIIC